MAATSDATANPPNPNIPRSGVAKDGWSTEDEATATCYCGAVQLAFPLKAPGLVNTFLCHCTDCRKITASQYASNFTVRDTHLRHLRGRENLTAWGQAETIRAGARMTNYFCSTCGTLMYRAGDGFPGMSALRVGTVDDFNVQETVLRPRMEIFVESRVRWLAPVEGAEQHQGIPFGKPSAGDDSTSDKQKVQGGPKADGRL